MLRFMPLLLLAATIVGCSSKAADVAVAPKADSPQQTAATTTVPADGLSGIVRERLDAAPYVYLRIETGSGDIWAAVPADPVEVGSTVTVLNPMQMSNFESKSLQRTFDEVYFGSLDAPAAATSTGVNPHAGAVASVALEVGTVEKAAGADARTVAEAWAQRSELAGNTISIRAKVVKYNPGILGSNWLHLQDGSGDAASGSNDITVTTLDEVSKGEVVTVTGVVQVDQDYGSGYRYPLMIVDAKITR